MTLDPDTRDELEAEANALSAALLLNLDNFTKQAHSYQPSLAAPLHLAGTFQTSRHAAIRRYVEDAPRPCALLVLGRFLNRPAGRPSLVVRQVIESETFRDKYGPAAECFPSRLPIDEPGIGRDANAALQGAVSVPLAEGRTTAQTPRRGSVSFDLRDLLQPVPSVRPDRPGETQDLQPPAAPERRVDALTVDGRRHAATPRPATMDHTTPAATGLRATVAHASAVTVISV
jgi:hypothetical protein